MLSYFGLAQGDIKWLLLSHKYNFFHFLRVNISLKDSKEPKNKWKEPQMKVKKKTFSLIYCELKQSFGKRRGREREKGEEQLV